MHELSGENLLNVKKFRLSHYIKRNTQTKEMYSLSVIATV